MPGEGCQRGEQVFATAGFAWTPRGEARRRAPPIWCLRVVVIIRQRCQPQRAHLSEVLSVQASLVTRRGAGVREGTGCVLIIKTVQHESPPTAGPAGTVPSETLILPWGSAFPREVLGPAWHVATILCHRLPGGSQAMSKPPLTVKECSLWELQQESVWEGPGAASCNPPSLKGLAAPQVSAGGLEQLPRPHPAAQALPGCS